MLPKVIDTRAALDSFDERWSPRIIAALDEHHIKLAKLEGEFVWHRHRDADEMFLVLGGELELRFREGSVHLRPGELCVVPRGTDHLPHAKSCCEVLLLERAGTVNTGDASERPGTTGRRMP